MKRLLVALLFMPVLSFAAVETTTINGQFLMSNGSPPVSGSITMTLSYPGTAMDGAVAVLVAGVTRCDLDPNGRPVTCAPVPNDVITPAGTVYHVSIVWRDSAGVGGSAAKRWSITTSPDPVNIGSITDLTTMQPLSWALDNNTDFTKTGSYADQDCIRYDASIAAWRNYPAADARCASGGGSPGGSSGQLQFNNAGALGGVSNITASGSTITVGAGGSLVPTSTGKVTASHIVAGTLASCGAGTAGKTMISGSPPYVWFCGNEATPILHPAVTSDPINPGIAELATAAYTATYLSGNSAPCGAGQFTSDVDWTTAPPTLVCGTPGAGVFLPLAGGTMTGAATMRNTESGLIFPPQPNTPGTNAASMEFQSRGSYDNGSWFVGNTDLPSGVGSEDHVLSLAYNGRWQNTLWVKPIATSHFATFQFESRFDGADPSTARGSYEINLNIDPNRNATIGSTYRPFFLGFNMDTKATNFTVGDTQISTTDPRLEINWRGKCDFCFWGDGSGPVEFGDRTVMGSDVDSITTQGRLIFDPSGSITPGTNRAPIIQSLFQQGYLNIESGIGTGGEIREIYFGRQLNSDVVFGTSGPLGRFTVDGSQDEIQVVIQGHSTQTTSLLVLENSAGTDQFTVSNAGAVQAAGTVTLENQSGIRLREGSGGGTNYVELKAPATLGADLSLAWNVTVATCTGDGNGGNLTVNGSNEIVCAADDGGPGSGDNIQVEDGDNLGTFTAMVNADFDDSGDINFIRAAGPPDVLTATVRADSVALTTDTTGNYVGSVADGTGIDGSAAGEGATYTPTLDLTETTNITFSAGGSGSFTHTFDVSGTDDVMTFGSGTVDFNGTVTATSFTADDPGDGLRGMTFSDNVTEPSAPTDTTPNSTLLYSFGGELYKKDEGDSTNERLMLNSGIVTGDVTFTSAGVAAIGASKVTDAMLANNYSGVGACGANTWASTLNDNAAPTCTQPAFSNLSGTITSAQIPADEIVAADVASSLDTRKCGHLYLLNVATTDEFVIRLPPFAGTMTRIDCEAFSGTSFTIDICDGEDIGDDTCTTSIPGATMTCDTTGANDTTLTNPGFAARDKVSLVVTAVSGTVNGDVYITCTVD